MRLGGHVAVVGASGFVGSAVVNALTQRGYHARPVRAPRPPAMPPIEAVGYVESRPEALADLATALQGCRAVVNAAGCARADSREMNELTAANGALPGLVAAAAREAGAERFVHVSSAAVQGRRPLLDDSDDFAPFSPYSMSKVLGERLAQRFSGESAVIYRPPSVHGRTRPQSRSIVRVASSPLGSVARPGSSPSPQSLIENVGDAVAFLATTAQQPPRTVIHPWEGLSTSDVMEVLGGRSPVRLPRTAARAVVDGLTFLGRRLPALAATSRRIEILWFGQEQAPSWLTIVGWLPPAGRAAWVELGICIRESQENIDA